MTDHCHQSPFYCPPMSDLCLIAVIRQMSAMDRTNALNVSLRWFHLVREVNQSTRSLTIAIDWNSLDRVEDVIIRFCAGSSRSLSLLKNNDGSKLYTLHRSTKWNTLLYRKHQLNRLLVENVIAAYSTITELIFVCDSCDINNSHLILLLRNDLWRHQLVTFKLFNFQEQSTRTKELFDAINDLPLLRKLHLQVSTFMYDLQILPQLEELQLDCRSQAYSAFIKSLSRCVNRDVHFMPSPHTAANNLQIELIQCTDYNIAELKNLPLQYRNLFTRLRYLSFGNCFTDVLSIIANFSSLTSLSLQLKTYADLHQVFNSLATLTRLVHLKLNVSYLPGYDYRENVHPEPTMLQAKVKSVKALDLSLSGKSHTDLQWLNLPCTLPNLEAIHFLNLYCHLCNVRILDFNLNYPAHCNRVRKCFYVVFQTLHPRVPLSQMSCFIGSEFCTMDRLFPF